MGGLLAAIGGGATAAGKEMSAMAERDEKARMAKLMQDFELIKMEHADKLAKGQIDYKEGKVDERAGRILDRATGDANARQNANLDEARRRYEEFGASDPKNAEGAKLGMLAAEEAKKVAANPEAMDMLLAEAKETGDYSKYATLKNSMEQAEERRAENAPLRELQIDDIRSRIESRKALDARRGAGGGKAGAEGGTSIPGMDDIAGKLQKVYGKKDADGNDAQIPPARIAMVQDVLRIYATQGKTADPVRVYQMLEANNWKIGKPNEEAAPGNVGAGRTAGNSGSGTYTPRPLENLPASELQRMANRPKGVSFAEAEEAQKEIEVRKTTPRMSAG
jgi:hypothetical protein